MSFVKVAEQSIKEQYMQRVYSMTHEQLFHELMRVHGESAKLLAQAQAELDRLKEIVDGKAQLERLSGDGEVAGGVQASPTADENRDDARIVLPASVRQKKTS